MDKFKDDSIKAKPLLLIVEDEGITAIELQNKLKNEGYRVPFTVSSGEEAILKAFEIKPDLILMDIMLEGKINGIEAANEIKKIIYVPIIFITAYGDEETLQKAKITDPHAYIIKPFEDKEVKYAIEIALNKHKIELKLKNSLIEKEMLLEVITYHLQNNHQKLSDLINYNVLENSSNNTNLTNNIHQELKNIQGSSEFALVGFALYIETLIGDLMRTSDLNLHSVDLNLNVDNFMLDLNTSLSCGLIINELVKTFLKKLHIKEKCKIDVDFYLYEGKFILSVRGNDNIDFEGLNSNYSSFKLVNSLVKQLDGSIITNEKNGSEIQIKFSNVEPLII